MSQFEMFAPTAQPVSTVPSADQVRARLESLMRTLRQADTLPLTEKQLRFWRTVVPQMTNWLPAEEKAAVCAEFDAHLIRLERKAA
ncbi:MAG: hypothetical protein Q8R45_07000 [Brevundimonas sp.]|uniref:hypothetical protein n=1 Tax=Brevundimonas sp. TaxID=1871086 RepID=UPI0027334393|nr:hypothetical protein [Brevundimonas sp.]MDP3656693.1 hypothetical protein [Brevundimonas sp.]MDZ4109388.1 hypothetical protein [Brevundimonas sp.]